VHIQNTNEYFFVNLEVREWMRENFIALEFFIDSYRLLTNWRTYKVSFVNANVYMSLDNLDQI